MKKVIMHKTIVILLYIFIAGMTFTADTIAKEPELTPAIGSVVTLPQAIAIAVEKDSGIKAAVENRKAAVCNKKSARADMLAKVHAKYSYTSLSDAPFQVMPMGTMEVRHDEQFHWDVTLVQPIFTGFALKNRFDMTRFEVEAKREEKKQAELDVIAKVKKAYFNLLLTRKRLLVADDAVKCLRAHEADAALLYKRGVIRLNDHLKAKVALANTLQQREKAIAGVEMTKSVLNICLDRDINESITIEDITNIPSENYDLKELIDEAMQKRPVFNILHFGVKILEKAVKLEKSAYYPEIALIGSYEQDGDDFSADQNDFVNNHMASITMEAKWTFFEWGKTRSKVSKARHEIKALHEKIEGIEDGITLEIKNAFLNLNVARKNIETAKQSLGQAKENWRITNLQYNQQIATSSEVLDARTFLTEADMNYYSALYGYMISLSELERSVGKR